MEDYKLTPTPVSTTTLGSDKDGKFFKEDWEYATIIRMLLCFSGNLRPGISYDLNQYARFIYTHRVSRAVEVRQILCYLQGTNNKDIKLKPINSYKLNCYVDANFARLWGMQYYQDPISVKSRTGCVITFLGCPIPWVSILQTQIALSTIEAEYISMSQSIQNLQVLNKF